MQKKSSLSSKLLFMCLCLAVFSSFHYFGMRTRVLEHVSSYVMYPILVAQNKVVMPIKHYFERNRSRREIEKLLDSLEQERNDLVAQNVQLNAMLSYRQETQELIDFKKQFELDAMLSQVLVKHFSDQSHYFLIDKGSNVGIAPDMVAIYKNCLLGKVIEVYPRYSKVLLVTDMRCKVAAYCAHTQASGIHEGTNNEKCTGIRYVSHLSQVEPEDLVLSSGDGLIFPKGFALGKIKKCHAEGLFYNVSIEPLLDLRKIDHCFIIQKGAIVNTNAINQMLIALNEDQKKEASITKKSVQIPKISPKVQTLEPKDIAEKIAITNTEVELMNKNELAQEQNMAAQRAMELAEMTAIVDNSTNKITV